MAASRSRPPRCTICGDLRLKDGARLKCDLEELTVSAQQACQGCKILLFAIEPYTTQVTTHEDQLLHVEVCKDSTGPNKGAIICTLLRYARETGQDATETVIQTAEICTTKSESLMFCTKDFTSASRGVTVVCRMPLPVHQPKEHDQRGYWIK